MLRPINVSNVNNFHMFRNCILEVVYGKTYFKAMSYNGIKITIQNKDDYRSIKTLPNKLKGKSKTIPFKEIEFQYSTHFNIKGRDITDLS